jgi:membrane protein
MRSAIESVRDVGRHALADNVQGEAAKVAWNFFFSLFPAILVLFAVTGYVGGEAVFDGVMARLEEVLPGEGADFFAGAVQEITHQRRPGILSLGLLFTLWGASNIFAGLMDGLNTMYDVAESRGFVRRRALAVACVLAGGALLVAGYALLLLGPQIGAWLGLGPVWDVARWPLAFLFLLATLTLVYFVLPNRDQRAHLRPVLGGAVAGTLLVIAVTLLFRLYVANFASYSVMYGGVGAIMVLLVWFYLTSLAILLGGEVAAVLEGLAERAEPDAS